MKTTCLIPVPVNEWIQRNPNNGPYNVYIGGKTPSNFFYEKDKEIHFGITHVLVPQSGYFFTEEEMKVLVDEVYKKGLDGEPNSWEVVVKYMKLLTTK